MGGQGLLGQENEYAAVSGLFGPDWQLPVGLCIDGRSLRATGRTRCGQIHCLSPLSRAKAQNSGQINIPAEDVKRYPELAEKRVGFGLSSILVETLFDTGRFLFLEEKEQLLKRLVELWELTEDGIFSQGINGSRDGLAGARVSRICRGVRFCCLFTDRKA